jgi:hypothetical protein
MMGGNGLKKSGNGRTAPKFGDRCNPLRSVSCPSDRQTGGALGVRIEHRIECVIDQMFQGQRWIDQLNQASWRLVLKERGEQSRDRAHARSLSDWITQSTAAPMRMFCKTV